MREGRNMYRVLVGKIEGKNHLKDQGVDGRMGSKWTLGRLVGGCGVDSSGQWRAAVKAVMNSGSGATELFTPFTINFPCYLK
jgi:hypothetical protein